MPEKSAIKRRLEKKKKNRFVKHFDKANKESMFKDRPKK